jgi:3-deoxy-D-manno-octulosonate 8-phosphate phosphatase (KDO 8-P phosphatase)
VAVANARPEVKAEVDYITRQSGGHGAVREVIDLILKTQDLWDLAVANMLNG